MNADTQKTRVAVLGAGLMGHGIAQSFMVSGFDVAIWDPDPAVRASVPGRIAEHLELMGDSRPIDLRIADTLEQCVAGATLVVEAAPEKLDLKRDLMSQIHAANPDCIVATNTSVLRITEIAQGSPNPTRVVGTHWWNPPYLMPLVEVVRGEQTDPEVARVVTQWLVQAGKTPVDVYRDVPGFVGNRMQFALVREAAYIVEQGICSPETVDLVARLTFGRRLPAIGPLRNADFIGLDLTCAIMDYLAPSLCDAKHAPELFRDKLKDGNLGAKSGRGTYEWQEGERNRTEQELLQHLIRLERDESAP